MGSTESWVYQREDGAVIWHVENDEPHVLRHGLEPTDTEITLESLDARLWNFPREYAEAKALLSTSVRK
jgi:hypothetical protein